MVDFTFMRAFFLLSIALIVPEIVFAQKIGLVLSGGGAKGLTHIGVIKALEENNIPIDYIVGTSIGGIVGGFYAAGYSAAQIEDIACSQEFQEWAAGQINEKYKYFYAKEDDNASWISLNMRIDSTLKPSLKSNIVNDYAMNFALMQHLAQASALANYQFDSLFVPFRCMASEIFTQEQIMLKSGNLSDALRATLAVPLFFPPIKIDNKYLFDGGVYNNFPVDVMKREFNPDFIIGVNVSSKSYNEYPFGHDEKLIHQSLLYLFLDKSNPNAVGDSGVYFGPDLENYTSFDFKHAAAFIKIGYDYTMARMDELKSRIESNESCEDLNERRNNFILQQKPLKFNNIKITGVKSNQAKYIRNLIKTNKKELTIFDLKHGYYKLIADEHLQHIYPSIKYNPLTGFYELNLIAKPEDEIKIDLGGNISSRSISSIFLGLQYNYFGRRLIKFNADFYTGRFYQSAQVKIRGMFPTVLPFYIEPEFTINNWDFIGSGNFLYTIAHPALLKQTDRKIGLNIGVSTGSRSKMVFTSAYFNNTDEFSNNNILVSSDTLDKTNFNGNLFSLRYLKNTLNRKQFATSGNYISIGVNRIFGTENYRPGNTSLLKDIIHKNHNWYKLRATHENYFKSSWNSWGYMIELVASNQAFFSNYKSTLIQAQGFNPLFDSRTIFMPYFRSYNYLAVGLKEIITIRKNLDLRIEGYAYKPYEFITESLPQNPDLVKDLFKVYFAGTSMLVYHTPVGPVSLSLNYHDSPNNKFSVLFNIGYLLFNQRSLD